MRVMVVCGFGLGSSTILKLKLDDLPNFASEQDELALKLCFTDQDQLIIQSDFINLVTVSFY